MDKININDRVKCVDDSVSSDNLEKGIEFPKLERIYTIQQIDKEGGYYLKEIFNDPDKLHKFESNKEPSFSPDRFQKVNDEYLQNRLTQILKEAYLENKF